jgi:ribose 1,5-bisphosphokinase PhnN
LNIQELSVRARVERMPLEKRLSKLIILIVGKSGSGKDTLMRESQKILQSQKSVPVNILQRVITRKIDISHREGIY